MRRRLTHASLTLVALAVWLLCSACYFRGLGITVGSSPGGYPSYTEEFTVSMGASSLSALCFEDFDTGLSNCSYAITNTDGFLVEIISTFDLLADFGFFGILIDPLIVQVPQSVGGVSATIDGLVVPVPLVVTETNSFKAGPETTVSAEQGMKFLILEVPPAIAASITADDPQDGQEFDFTLTLSSSTLPIATKTMFAVRIDAPGATYYLPTLPCTTDFADIPEISVGFASILSGEADIRANIDAYAALACAGQVYDLRAVQAPGEHIVFIPGLAFD